MVRGSHILGIVVVSCLLRQAIGTAGGIETWCAFRDPFIDVGLTRATYFQGATPCRINGFDNSLTDCSTSDGWGIDIEQCVYPGYNPINQPVSYPANTVLPGYPGTFDQTLACNQVVFMSELVDSANITYGEVRVFKDYSDKLYVTATVRPVFFGSNSSMYQPPQLNSRQWLHSQPSAPVPFNQYSPATPLGPAAGKVIVANAANYDPTLSNAAYVNQLSISPITPSQFCGANSTGTGCLPNNVLDLTASTNLFLYVEFTIVALNLFNTSVSSLGPSCGTVADTKTIRLPGSGVVDLYAATIWICSIVVSMTKNFSAGLPFDTQTDPARLAQNLNLLCGTGVRPAFGAQLFVPTGISAPAQIQVGALVYSAVDQTTFFNCINSSPSTIQVIALAYSLECTDSISIAYSCSAQPTSFYSGIANQPAGAMQWLHIDGATVGDVRCTNKGVGGDYVDVMYDTIDSAGLTSCLPSGSSDVLCSDSTATGSVITVVFTKQSCASDLYTAMTSGSGVLTAGYVQSASIPCAAVLLLQTSGRQRAHHHSDDLPSLQQRYCDSDESQRH
eukprot:gene8650-biopygen15553